MLFNGIDYPTVNGILFIGDPHVTSIKPSRRLDADISETITDKIKQAAEIANKRKLLPVFLGDMMDRAKDSDVLMLTRLLRALNAFELRPLCLVGNHDIRESKVTDNVTLGLLSEAQALSLITTNGIIGELAIKVKSGEIVNVSIGATPYGMEIPDEVEHSSQQAVWITHHDLGFEGSYPGVASIKEIKGINVAVNGHMHLTKPAIEKGMTTWWNPGNITRMSVDARDHVPSVWEWVPFSNKLKQHKLKFEKEIFNLSGYMVKDSDIASSDDVQASVFVELLKEESGDLTRSEDGGMLKEDLNTVMEELKIEGAVASIITLLHTRVSNRLNGDRYF